MQVKFETILTLRYITALGDLLRQCAGNNIELGTDTLTAIGCLVMDLARQSLEDLQKAEKEAA